MARTAEGAALTAGHQRQQLALRAAMLREITQLWPIFDGSPDSYARFADAAAVLIAARHQQSSGLAAGYLRRFAGAEGVGGAATPALAPRLPGGFIGLALRATGLAGFYRALRAGRTTLAARASGLVQASGAAGRLALEGGRGTILAAVRADPAALGWVRVTAGDPCAFCAMLASRGAAYKSARTASFQAHDHCACTAEPAYQGSALPVANERYRELWELAQSKARFDGTLDAGTSNNPLNAFRRYLANPGNE